MQDPGAFGVLNQGFPEEQDQQQLKCPRCDSLNTKFCYYNNYNLSQPRYYCKACRRYWTKGGSLRNIPVGGASRKPTKRSAKRPGPKPEPEPAPAPSTTTQGQQQQQQQFGGSGCLLQEGLPGPNGPGQANGMARKPGSGLGLGLGGLDQLQSGDQDSSCNWSGNSDTTTTDNNNNNNGWPDLAFYPPDSRFQ